KAIEPERNPFVSHVTQGSGRLRYRLPVSLATWRRAAARLFSSTSPGLTMEMRMMIVHLIRMSGYQSCLLQTLSGHHDLLFFSLHCMGYSVC
ncbi:steryl-sulfatase, partial [Clarias magur]